MKKYLKGFFCLASLIMLGYAVSNLYTLGLLDAVKIEVSRYADVNVNYLYMALIFILGSYPVGWIFSKLRVRD